MEYLINLTYDPFICSFSVSLILSIGLAFIWNRFRIHSYSYVYDKPAEIAISAEYTIDCENEKMQNPIMMWIIKFVRRKESSQDESDHHLSVIQ